MAPDRPVPRELAAQLDEARVQAGYTVDELADACSLSRDHLHDVLAGTRPISPVVARRLLAALYLHEPPVTDDEVAARSA